MESISQRMISELRAEPNFTTAAEAFNILIPVVID